MKADYTKPIYDGKPLVDINQHTLICQSEDYVLSNPEVIKALQESARNLGTLTRHEHARITFGNMNE